MTKLREFWINEDPDYLISGTARFSICTCRPLLPVGLYSIHTREVLPELDAAYEKCEKFLQHLIDYEAFIDGGPAWAEIIDCLAVLKKAREE